MKTSLQARLLGLVVGAVTAGWLAAAALTWVDARHELDELLDGHLAQAAALLVAQQSGDGDHDDDDDHGGVDAPILHRYAPKVAFQVFHEGRLVQRSANAPLEPLFGARRVEHDDDHAAPLERGYATVDLQGERWRVFAARGAEHDVQVYVGEAIAARNEILRSVLRGGLLPLLAGLPLLAALVWWAVRQGMAPLRRLGRQLAERQPEALGAVPVDDLPAEMVPMVEALNALFARIGRLLQGERRFTADAAHELRTPIAAIRAQAQVALGADDDASRRHALEQTLAGCDRAIRLVEQLLTLARLEAEADSGERTAGHAVDLAGLTRRVAAELAPAALARGQTLELEADGPVLLPGHETLLAVLVRNLLDNALRYSPDGAQVLVRVDLHDGHARLRLDDSGPGLAEADLARLGERFFRVLGSGRSGSGLGWSIVRRIAAVHGLEVQVERSAELGGLRVQVRGPVDTSGA